MFSFSPFISSASNWNIANPSKRSSISRNFFRLLKYTSLFALYIFINASFPYSTKQFFFQLLFLIFTLFLFPFINLFSSSSFPIIFLVSPQTRGLKIYLQVTFIFPPVGELLTQGRGEGKRGTNNGDGRGSAVSL